MKNNQATNTKATGINRYPEEFRRKAINRALTDSRPLGVIARELGISPSTLRRWKSSASAPPIHSDVTVDIIPQPKPTPINLNVSFCSWCMQRASFTLAEENFINRNVYRCSNCGRPVSKCLAIDCNNFACNGEISIPRQDGSNGATSFPQHHWYCSEHRGVVPDFQTADKKLADIESYKNIYEFKKTNYETLSRKTASLIIAGFATAVSFWFAGPAIGGYIGSILGLSGAAAVSAGLAFLGGGSLAAGGLGMAGGLAVVTVGGLGLGGYMGCLLGTAYHGDICGFGILRKKSGRYPAVITIDGFLSDEKEFDGRDWQSMIDDKFPDHAWYHVKWESQTLASIGATISSIKGYASLSAELAKVAARATKGAPIRGGQVALIMSAMQLAKNPWHVAMVKSEKTGVLLADILRRSTKGPFILIGHSLGCRVIYSTLETLAHATGTDGKPLPPIIREAHLLGGAVGTMTTTETVATEKSGSQTSTVGSNWESAGRAVSHTIYNYYSTNDYVLKSLYSVGTFFASQPAGRNPIPVAVVNNIDASSIIRDHFDYKPNSQRLISTTL